MPPAVSRFAPQNLSNPFAHLNQHSIHQSSHNYPNPNLQNQNLGGHPGYSGGNPNLFNPSSGNAGMPGGFGGGGLGGGGNPLASHAAQMGFAHGAALQQQAHEAAAMGGGGAKGMGSRIREVWANNLQQEVALLRNLVDRYPYISMDTEFPGVVARPMGDFQSKASYHYQTVRCNVDLLRIIQLGITLFSVDGEVPPSQPDIGVQVTGYQKNLIMCPCTWSFNFQFSLDEDMYAEESITMLKKSGSDFEKHSRMGIDPLEFASLLITSGLVLSDDVTWISFHSGYDFAYLVKLMWCKSLPPDEEAYRRLVKTFFPRLLDVKYLWKYAQKLAGRNALSAAATNHLNNLGQKSGLQDLAEELGCQRVGTQHQAGSDAWLTGTVFWQMRDKIFGGRIPEDVIGEMWGLTGVAPPASASTQQAVLAMQGHAPGTINGAVSAAGLSGTVAFPTSGGTARDGGPSTPTTNAAGLSTSTPGPPHQSNLGTLTPGGGGVFGNFQYSVPPPVGQNQPAYHTPPRERRGQRGRRGTPKGRGWST